MPLEQELEPGQKAGWEPALEATGGSALRDNSGRTLDQAQQEDQRWREEEIRWAEETAFRVRRLEGRVGLSAAAVGMGLIALGMGCFRLIDSGPNEAQWLSVVPGIFLGSAALCLSAAFLLAVGKKYRVYLRRRLRYFGQVVDEPRRKRRKLAVRKRT